MDKMKVEKYAEYKDSRVEWLGEIPKSWETFPIKRLGKTKAGGTPSTTNLKYWDGEVPWLPSGKLQNCEINTAEKFITESGLKNSATKLIKSNTTLIALTGATCANIGFLKFEACANQSVIAIEENEDVNSKFLYYALINERKQILLNQTGGAQAGINETDVKNIIITTPSLPEQTAIAAFLDRKTALIDQAIGIKQKQIELLKERRQILIHKAVTHGLNPNVKMKDSGVEWIGEIPERWEVKKLKYVLNERNDRSLTGDEPLFMISQIHGLVVRADFHEKAEVAKTSEGNKIVHKNDLVFNKLKAHLGVFFKSTIDFNGIVSPDYAVYYSNGIIDDVKYLELLFRCPEYLKQFICRITGIVEGLMRLYTHDLFDIAIPVPPINEQKEMLNFIFTSETKIATAISLKEQEIEKLKEYKATLINSAVTGKIKIC